MCEELTLILASGAAQGIGKEAALQFAREGAKVVVSDLDESESEQADRSITVIDELYCYTEKAQAVVDEIKAAGGEAFAISGNGTHRLTFSK